jgi:hypothetical protein
MKSLHEFTASIPEGKKKQKVKVGVFKLPAVRMDAARHYHAQQYNQLVSEGFLTRAMIGKKFGDIGGMQSKQDTDALNTLVASWIEAQRVFALLGAAENLDEDQKARLSQAEKDIASFQLQITTYQKNIDDQFASSADAHAEERIMRWFLIHTLFYKDKVGDAEENFPLFDGANFNDKLAQYYEMKDGAEGKAAAILGAAEKEASQAIYLFWQGLADETNMAAKIKEFFKQEEKGD